MSNRIFSIGDSTFRTSPDISEEELKSIVSKLSERAGQAMPDANVPAPMAATPAVASPAPMAAPVPAAAPSPTESVTPFFKTPKANLGALSAKYESGPYGSSAIGKDKQGGVSFGKYQISQAQGTLKDFLQFAKERAPDVYSKLAPLEKTASNISGKFSLAWKKLSAKEELQKLEHDFIKQTHYDESLKLLKEKGFDFSGRPDILQDVIWSTAVQHGPSGASDIISSLGAPKKVNSLPSKALINKIYDKRLTQFPNATEKEKASVVRRFTKERSDALSALKKEIAPKRRQQAGLGELNGANPPS